uniref:Uncharacterized protein n=1 Tax=Oryza meridionalis TaxID=40149 RepID=A0A0E0DT96_9ORYZ
MTTASSSSSSTRTEVEAVGGVFVCNDLCGSDIVRNLIVDYGSSKIALTVACMHFRVPGTALNLPFHCCVTPILPALASLPLPPKKKSLPPLSPTAVAKEEPTGPQPWG